MYKQKHIVPTWLLSLMLSLAILPLLAQDAEMGGLHCGEVVVITATPDSGYVFLQWSDGNTDNPREIEITDAVNLTVEFAPICLSDTVPVVLLYNQLMMINADSLQRMGYIFSEQSVNWYRIVGDIDTRSFETNDQWLCSGYYYNLSSNQPGSIYATVDISATSPVLLPRCTDLLYSQPVYFDIHKPDPNNNTSLNIRKEIINEQLYIIYYNRVYRSDGSLIKP